MSTTNPVDLDAFRDEVRRFVAEKVPESLKIEARSERLALDGDSQRQFNRLLYE